MQPDDRRGIPLIKVTVNSFTNSLFQCNPGLRLRDNRLSKRTRDEPPLGFVFCDLEDKFFHGAAE